MESRKCKKNRNTKINNGRQKGILCIINSIVVVVVFIVVILVVVVVVADDVEEGEDFRCSCDGSMTLRKMGILFSEIFIVCLEMRKQKEREMNRERKTARDIETERKKERKAVDKLNLVKLAYGGIRI